MQLSPRRRKGKGKSTVLSYCQGPLAPQGSEDQSRKWCKRKWWKLCCVTLFSFPAPFMVLPHWSVNRDRFLCTAVTYKQVVTKESVEICFIMGEILVASDSRHFVKSSLGWNDKRSVLWKQLIMKAIHFSEICTKSFPYLFFIVGGKLGLLVCCKLKKEELKRIGRLPLWTSAH